MNTTDSTDQIPDLDFEPLQASFEMTNDEWARAYLPRVRLATIIVRLSKQELCEKVFAEPMDEEEGDAWVTAIEEMLATAEHLKSLHDLCETCAARLMVVLGAEGREARS